MIQQFVFVVFLISMIGTAAAEHPVSIVQADVFVQRFKTTMRLSCFAEDLELLQGVEPLDDGMYDEDELLDAHEDHAKFLAERIELLNVNGEKLKPRITDIAPFEIPPEGIMQGMLMNFTLQFELEFQYDEPPEFLTINQRMVAEGMLLPSELKILIKQAGSDEPMLHMMKPQAPKVFRFDWNSAPLNSDTSEEDRNKWFEDQREKSLGITSYSSVYSFIYITDTQVRHEVLIPVASLASFMEMERTDERFLEIEEQDAVKPFIKALFDTSKNQVKIDGIVVQPVFDRIDFYGLDVRDFVTQAARRKISMANGRVGVIMAYETKSSPKEVEVSWETFNEVVKTVDSVVFEFDEVKRAEFSRFLVDNTYTWKDPGRPPLPSISGIESGSFSSYSGNTLSIPVISCILVMLSIGLVMFCRKLLGTSIAIGTAVVFLVCGLLAHNVSVAQIQNPFWREYEDADKVFEQLHKNVFRAFDYHSEESIYDALANSVDGEQLRKLYLDVRESLRVQEQGGAIARIDEVNIVDGEQTRPETDSKSPAFGYRCKWNLVGTIEHWGHIHQRETQYNAHFDVELRDNAWKITSMQVDDQKHGRIKTSVRKF